MITGLTAFPLTPLDEERIDEEAFSALVARLAAAGVDGLGVLGSTGNYAYLTGAERARVARLAVQAAGDTPVVVGIGALRTRDVLAHAEAAQAAGAAGLLLAPVSYHPLSEDEVVDLFAAVAAQASVPVVVYDNPGTTHVTFTDELHGRLAQLEHVAAVKIPPPPSLVPEAAARTIGALRAHLPAGHHVGISGDPAAAIGLTHGCDGWYSMIGAVLPEHALRVTRAATAGDVAGAVRAAADLEPVWALYRRFGSLRTCAALAVAIGDATEPVLPRPLRPVPTEHRTAVADALAELGVQVRDGAGRGATRRP